MGERVTFLTLSNTVQNLGVWFVGDMRATRHDATQHDMRATQRQLDMNTQCGEAVYLLVLCAD